MSLDQLEQVVEEANSIWKNPDLNPELKFDLIFSRRISQWVWNNCRSFDWYDPDTSYEEDVDAFMYALNSYYRAT